jgi:F-type H+-transporting ATPase subunit alpha
MVPTNRVRQWEQGFLDFLEAQRPEVLDRIRETKALSDEIETNLKSAIADFNARWEAEQGAAAS